MKANVNNASHDMEHARKVNADKGSLAERKSFVGVGTHVDQDNFVYSEMKKSKENMAQSERYAAKKLRPHVGGDAVMFDYVKNVRQQRTESPAARSPFEGAATKVDGNAFALAQMRVTKAQTPAAQRSYQGVKPSMGGDNYHMNFLKSAKKSWGGHGAQSKEVRV